MLNYGRYCKKITSILLESLLNPYRIMSQCPSLKKQHKNKQKMRQICFSYATILMKQMILLNFLNDVGRMENLRYRVPFSFKKSDSSY